MGTPTNPTPAKIENQRPVSGPQTLNVQFGRQWDIVRPRVYRWLEKQYVDAFFEDGTLRLSSFAQFSKHQDEPRKDAAEGRGIRTGIGDNITVMMVSGRGMDCYVLCGSTTHTNEISESLKQYDACFVIDDIMGFANAVSQRLPYFVGGVEGAVIYKDSTEIERSLGSTTVEQLMEPHKHADGTLDFAMIQQMGQRLGGVEELLVTHSRYAKQFEYRLLWCTGANVSDYIDIKVPNARQFCRRVER